MGNLTLNGLSVINDACMLEDEIVYDCDDDFICVVFIGSMMII